jgi:Tfp pilus assembly protein PilX
MSGSGLFAIFFVVVLGLIALGMVQSVLCQQQIGELRRSGTRVAATVTVTSPATSHLA